MWRWTCLGHVGSRRSTMRRVCPPPSLDCNDKESVESSPWIKDATPRLWKNEFWYDRQIAGCFLIHQFGSLRISWSDSRSADMCHSTQHFWQVRHFWSAPTCLWLLAVCLNDSGMCHHWTQSWSSLYHRLRVCQNPRNNRCRRHHLSWRCSLTHSLERSWARGTDKSGHLLGSRAHSCRGSDHLTLQ